MEGTTRAARGFRRSGPPTLALWQEFSGGRLERQWLCRAYELVVPTVCVVAGRIRVADFTEPSEHGEAMDQPAAKGA